MVVAGSCGGRGARCVLYMPAQRAMRVGSHGALHYSTMRTDCALTRDQHVLSIMVHPRHVIVMAAHDFHIGFKRRDFSRALHSRDHIAHHQIAVGERVVLRPVHCGRYARSLSGRLIIHWRISFFASSMKNVPKQLPRRAIPSAAGTTRSRFRRGFFGLSELCSQQLLKALLTTSRIRGWGMDVVF